MQVPLWYISKTSVVCYHHLQFSSPMLGFVSWWESLIFPTDGFNDAISKRKGRVPGHRNPYVVSMLHQVHTLRMFIITGADGMHYEVPTFTATGLGHPHHLHCQEGNQGQKL